MQSKIFNKNCNTLIFFNRNPQWADYKNKEISSQCSYADKKEKPSRFFLWRLNKKIMIKEIEKTYHSCWKASFQKHIAPNINPTADEVF